MATTLQDTVVLFGDSLTQACHPGSLASLVSDTYATKLDVINRGFGGYTTEWSLPIFNRIFTRKDQREALPEVKLVTIWFGANDAVLPSYASERTRGVPLDRYMANLDHFVASLVDAGSNNRCLPGAQILLITSPPFLSSTRVNAPGRPATLDLEHTRRYKDACKTVGKVWKKKASGREQTLDAWKALVDAAGDESQESLRPFYVYDGVHLSTKGYQVLYNEFLRIIESDWPHLDPTRKI